MTNLLTAVYMNIYRAIWIFIEQRLCLCWHSYFSLYLKSIFFLPTLDCLVRLPFSNSIIDCNIGALALFHFHHWLYVALVHWPYTTWWNRASLPLVAWMNRWVQCPPLKKMKESTNSFQPEQIFCFSGFSVMISVGGFLLSRTTSLEIIILRSFTVKPTVKWR